MKSATWRGLSVNLRVYDVDMQEYVDDNVEEDTPNVETRYVEAVAGASFTVELSHDELFKYKDNDLRMSVLLDGVWVTSKIYDAQPHILRVRKSCHGIGRHADGAWHLEKFTFAELLTTDASVNIDLKKRLANVGEVTVKLHRVKSLGNSADQSQNHFPPPSVDYRIPEKALKGRAISTRTTWSHGGPCAPVNWVDVEYPWGPDPFVTFKFKYRSHKDLQIEGVIPRSPSPTPLEERDFDSLSTEQKEELARRQHRDMQDRIQIKREKRDHSTLADDEDNDDDEVTISEAPHGRKRYKTFRDSGVEVIDLSDD